MAFRKDIKQRIMSKIKYKDDCWIWTGATAIGIPIIGYWFSDERIQRHRPVRRILYKGNIGAKVYVTCENDLCVNPNHLTLNQAAAYFQTRRRG